MGLLLCVEAAGAGLEDADIVPCGTAGCILQALRKEDWGSCSMIGFAIAAGAWEIVVRGISDVGRDGSGSLAKGRDRVVAVVVDVDWETIDEVEVCMGYQEGRELFEGRRDSGSWWEAGKMWRLRRRWRVMSGNGGPD